MVFLKIVCWSAGEVLEKVGNLAVEICSIPSMLYIAYRCEGIQLLANFLNWNSKLTVGYSANHRTLSYVLVFLLQTTRTNTFHGQKQSSMILLGSLLWSFFFFFFYSSKMLQYKATNYYTF